MTIPANARAGVRSRTRRAILGAAASVLARDRSATLANIAEAAEVGRSTLHRYFPDREGLLEAVVEDSLETLDRAVAEAALDQGPPLEAMRRLWALVYTAAGGAANGRLPRHGVTATAIRTFEHGIRAGGSLP